MNLSRKTKNLTLLTSYIMLQLHRKIHYMKLLLLTHNIQSYTKMLCIMTFIIARNRKLMLQDWELQFSFLFTKNSKLDVL